MTAHAGTAYIDLKPDWSGFDKDVDRQTSGVKSKFSKVGKAAVAGLAVGLGGAVVAVKGFVDAAVESEKSQARMKTQLKALGISYKGHAKQIDDVIQKHSRLSGLDDEDLQDSFTNIVRITGDVNKSLKLNALAADFARAKHMDVAKAGELVGKVAGGNTGILSRYGIQIEKGATSTEALGLLQKKFSGQAEAYGKTTAGAQERFGVAIENLQEKLGEKLLPIIAKVANVLAKFVDGLSSGEGAGGKFRDIIQGVVDVVKSVIGWITKYKDLLIPLGAAITGAAVAIGVYNAATKLAAISTAAFNAVLALNPMVLVVAGLAALAAGLIIAYKKSETFRDIVDAAFSVVKAAANALWDVFKVVFPAILDVVKGVWNAIKTVTSTVWDAIKTVLSGVFEAVKTVVTTYFNAYKKVIETVWDAIKAVTKTAWDLIKGFIIDPVRDAAGWVREKLGDLVGWFREKFDAIAGFAGNLADKIKTGLEAGFRGAVNLVIGFVNGIIKVINKIPGVEIGLIGKVGTDKGPEISADKLAHGGVVRRPMAIVGEEAPRHPEFVIPTNPAYRGRAVGLFGQLGHQLRIPGYAEGGILGKLVDALPNPAGALPGWLRGTGRWAIEHITRWIKDKLGSVVKTVGELATGHTFDVASSVARRFGLIVGSGYRTPEHNRAVGGVEGSLHTHGTPENPGAWDLYGPVPRMYEALAWVQEHLKLQEALVHDVGSGLHLHMGFFRKGGVLGGPFVGSYATGGIVPRDGLAAVHAGERITPAGPEVVHVHRVYLDGRELDVKVDSRVEKFTRGQARVAARALPGRGGGRLA